MEINCPICKKQMSLFTSNNDIQIKSIEGLFSAFECKDCDILFQYPFWKPEETGRFYETNYYAHSEDFELTRSLRILNFYLKGNLFSRLLSPYLRKKLYPYFAGMVRAKKVLDIGCGKGLFLDVMKMHHKKTYGLEPSVQASALAAQRGHEMLTRELFYSSQNKLKFDLITMFQVAEHLSVQELLEEDVFARIYNALEPGGQLVIETPTHDCNYARKFRSDWRALEMPRHLVIFSPKSLSKMLTAKGFSVKVFTRVSPIDVKESFLLRYPGKGIKTLFRKGSHLLRIMFFQKRNSSLLTVVAQKGF